MPASTSVDAGSSRPMLWPVVVAHAQLVGHHLQPRQRAHAREQRHVVDRLGQKIVGAGLQPRTRSAGWSSAVTITTGNVRGRRIGFDAAADLEAVHAGHHHVEQDDVGFAARRILASASAPE